MSYLKLVAANTATTGKTGSEPVRVLRPVSTSTSESADLLSVRANVLGFEENELNVSVEPKRITILGKKEVSATGNRGRKTYFYGYPDQILQVIDLATEVMPESAVVELQAGS